jgi:hypothetical protein
MREGIFYYLHWGWALILASLANYFLIRQLIRMERYDEIMLKSLLAWGCVYLYCHDHPICVPIPCQ